MYRVPNLCKTGAQEMKPKTGLISARGADWVYFSREDVTATGM